MLCLVQYSPALSFLQWRAAFTSLLEKMGTTENSLIVCNSPIVIGATRASYGVALSVMSGEKNLHA